VSSRWLERRSIDEAGESDDPLLSLPYLEPEKTLSWDVKIRNVGTGNWS